MVSNRLFTKENEKVEWKRDLPRPDELAKEIIAFANSDGGSILLGVDDGGNIIGIIGVDEEHIINIARNNCVPPIMVKVKRFEKDKKQLIEISVPRGENPPYSNNHRYLIRVGNTVRDASIQELLRLIVRGDHRGSILLLSNLETLRKNIRAGVHSGSKNGYETATQKIIELCELIDETKDHEMLEDGLDVLLDVSLEVSINNSKLTHTIIQELDMMVVVLEMKDFYDKFKIKKIVGIIFEILYNVKEYRPKAVSNMEAAFALLERIGEASINMDDNETLKDIIDSAKYFKKGKLHIFSQMLVENLNQFKKKK